MNKGFVAVAIWLLAFLKLLWAKLPGPSASPAGFRFKRGKESEEIEVFYSDGKIDQFFSSQTTGITVQEVKSPTSWESAASSERPLQSRVKVEITEPDTAKLRDLNPDVLDLLLRGSGQIAIVTGVVKEGRLEAEKEFLARGRGRGVWEILLRTK